MYENWSLTDLDKWNLNKLCEGSGWDVDNIREELMNLNVDPTEREIRYYSLFEKYYKEAEELKKRNDYMKATEKL